MFSFNSRVDSRFRLVDAAIGLGVSQVFVDNDTMLQVEGFNLGCGGSNLMTDLMTDKINEQKLVTR